MSQLFIRVSIFTAVLCVLACERGPDASDQGVEPFAPAPNFGTVEPSRRPSSSPPSSPPRDAALVDEPPAIERAFGTDVIFADHACIDAAICLLEGGVTLNEQSIQRCASLIRTPNTLAQAVEWMDCALARQSYESLVRGDCVTGAMMWLSGTCEDMPCVKSTSCFEPVGCFLNPNRTRSCGEAWFDLQGCAPGETACVNCAHSTLSDEGYTQLRALHECASRLEGSSNRAVALGCPAEWSKCFGSELEERSCARLLRCVVGCERDAAERLLRSPARCIDSCALHASDLVWEQRADLFACADAMGLSNDPSQPEIYPSEVAQACPEAWATCGVSIKERGAACEAPDICARGTFCNPTEGRCLDIACGDGHQVGAEECDDGNEAIDDGCEGCLKVEIPLGATCVAGYSCVEGAYCEGREDIYGAQICALYICGDGRLDPGEVCDDGNNQGDDGCSTDCMSQALVDASSGGDFEGVVEVHSVQRFTFNLQAPAALIFEVSPRSGDRDLCAIGQTDPVLTLWTRGGALVAEDDDGGLGDRCPRLTLALEAGEYELEVRDYNRNTPLEYQLSVQRE